MTQKTDQIEATAQPVEKQPVIDFSEMSYDDAMQMALLEAKFQRLALMQERIGKGDVPAAIYDELLELTKPGAMEEVFIAVRTQMAKVVRWLPEDWFVPDTPPELSLRQPDTYRWLRADKSKELRTLIQKAQQSASKNSGGG